MRGIRYVAIPEYVYRVTQKEGPPAVHRDMRINVKRIPVEDYEEVRGFFEACLRQDEEMVLPKMR